MAEQSLRYERFAVRTQNGVHLTYKKEVKSIGIHIEYTPRPGI